MLAVTQVECRFVTIVVGPGDARILARNGRDIACTRPKRDRAATCLLGALVDECGVDGRGLRGHHPQSTNHKSEPPVEDELEPIDLEELIDSFLTPGDQGSSWASVSD